MNLRIRNSLNFLVFLFVIYFFVLPQPTRAVIPPDFIFNIGTQVAQFFTIIVIFFSAISGTFFQFFNAKFSALKHKKMWMVAFTLLLIFLALALSYAYAKYKQQSEYKKWLEESQKNASASNSHPDISQPNDNIVSADTNDQLTIGSDGNIGIDASTKAFVSKIDENDASAKFISEYYSSIANKNFEHAYDMSKKEVDLNTFKGWYLNTTKIVLDKLVRIDGKRLSIELTLYEGQAYTRYGVLVTLLLENSTPLRIEKSEVSVLARGSIQTGKENTDNSIVSDYIFFNQNENNNVITTNQEFKNITESGKSDYVVLDARENIEYENGYYPDSLHVRFADLKAGRWIELPKDKFVYVICWSGIRGKEVTEFLRTKRIVASYLENGANGWVGFGGKWVGNIKFGEQYTDARYQLVFTTSEVKAEVKEGVVLVDTREPNAFQKSHIVGSFNIPIMYTPTIDIENVFAQVRPGSKVITVCDGYVNCFDAKITGVELERRGHQFLGRYNKPWEYEK